MSEHTEGEWTELGKLMLDELETQGVPRVAGVVAACAIEMALLAAANYHPDVAHDSVITIDGVGSLESITFGIEPPVAAEARDRLNADARAYLHDSLGHLDQGGDLASKVTHAYRTTTS